MTVVTNDGTAEVWPIIYVYGATNAFSITNNSVLDDVGNPLSFVYDAVPIATAGGIPLGEYAIIDMFQNTIILASTGISYADGIVMQETDFFPLVPGPNDLTTTGAPTTEVVRPVTGWA